MATIGSDVMIVPVEQRQDKTWLFTICYTATSAAVFRKKRIVLRDGVFGARPQHGAICVSVRLHRYGEAA